MISLRLVESAPWTGGYSSGDVRVAWVPGEVREVSEVVAAYLTGTYPDLFVPPDAPVAPPPPAEVVPDPDPSLHPVQPTAQKGRPPKPKPGR